MQNNAKTVRAYLAALPADRRKTIEAVRAVVLDHLPKGYEEGMQYGMIGYYVPLARYPDTYNGQALGYAGLASQKQYISLYLNCEYAKEDQETFREKWEATGRKLDMGKSCVRFKKLEDVALDVVGESIPSTPVDDFIALYEKSRS